MPDYSRTVDYDALRNRIESAINEAFTDATNVRIARDRLRGMDEHRDARRALVLAAREHEAVGNMIRTLGWAATGAKPAHVNDDGEPTLLDAGAVDAAVNRDALLAIMEDDSMAAIVTKAVRIVRDCVRVSSATAREVEGVI